MSTPFSKGLLDVHLVLQVEPEWRAPRLSAEVRDLEAGRLAGGWCHTRITPLRSRTGKASARAAGGISSRTGFSDASAGGGEGPAVERAAEAARLERPDPEVRPEVRAEGVQHRDRAVLRAEEDHLAPQRLDLVDGPRGDVVAEQARANQPIGLGVSA